jgi:predicted esterase YcpF (UPF0227 family)
MAWLTNPTSATAIPDATDMLAVIATGDEVLDWQEMSNRYAKAHRHIIHGSDHGLSDFEVIWPKLLGFLFPSE